MVHANHMYNPEAWKQLGDLSQFVKAQTSMPISGMCSRRMHCDTAHLLSRRGLQALSRLSHTESRRRCNLPLFQGAPAGGKQGTCGHHSWDQGHTRAKIPC